MFVRPSAQPLFHKCASSQEPNDNPYTPKLEVATLGTAAHEVLEMVAEGRPYEEIADQAAAVAKKYRLKEDDLIELASLGMRLWK